MNSLVIKTIITYFIIISIIVLITFLFVRLYFSYLLEKRIKNFSLGIDDEKTSLMDKLSSRFLKIIKKLGKLVSKSTVLKSYAKYFEKYLIYFEGTIIASEYIAIKIFVMLFVQVLYFLSLTIKFLNFDIYSFLLISLLSFFLIDIIVIVFYNNKKKLIEEQLLQAVVIMNSAFKSGKNIFEAITIVKNELPSPIKEEFEIIYKDMSYGLSVHNAFDRFSKRVKLDEAKYITSSLALLSKTGGNIVTVFNMIEKNFYDRLKIKNELESLTSSSKFLYRILIIMPFIFSLVIIALNPAYFNPLINHPLGIIIIFAMVILYILYILIVKKIMKVEEV